MGDWYTLSFITRRTLVWQGTKFVVFAVSGYRYLGDGRRKILHHGT